MTYQIIRKIITIATELLNGLLATAKIGKAVTIFGSARFTEGNRYYDDAVKVAQLLASQYAIITGGGPGIMEAANRGATIAGAPSIGCSINLPFETTTNPWVKEHANFHRFFLRKFVMTRNSEAFIVFPGGYGTMDELFEILTLVQCQKQERPVKIVLYGKSYWQGLIQWMATTFQGQGTISKDDLNIFSIADSPQEVARLILHDPLPEISSPTVTTAPAH